jgi:hypothetical protein
LSVLTHHVDLLRDFAATQHVKRAAICNVDSDALDVERIGRSGRRDPYGSNDTQFCCDLAKQLAQQGDAVTVFLVQNGVLPARAGARADELSALAISGHPSRVRDVSNIERF